MVAAMYETQSSVKVLLPNGELLTLLGQTVRFELFYPEEIRGHITPEEATTTALVCLDRDGQEVARIKMAAILGYLFE
jgi:hypothetical protein